MPGRNVSSALLSGLNYSNKRVVATMHKLQRSSFGIETLTFPQTGNSSYDRIIIYGSTEIVERLFNFLEQVAL